MKKIILLLSCFLVTANVYASRIAVTDLAYTDEVEGYIHIVDYHNRSDVSASSRGAIAVGPYAAAAAASTSVNARSKTDYFEYEQKYSYVEYGELRGFTGDIKGEMLKSRHFELVQAKPVTAVKNEKIYDIIGRIKKGYYPGADFVLFGTVSEIHFSNDSYTPENAGSVTTQTFNLTIAVEFSLINTRTYQVVASFSAVGDGADTKIQSSGTYATPNRARVVADASKTLGKEVIKQLDEQIYSQIEPERGSDGYPQGGADSGYPHPQRGVTVFQ